MGAKERRDQAMARQQEIINTARTANRDLTPEEQTELNNLQRDIETANTEIENEARSAQNQQQASDAVAAERQRIAEVNTLCREFGVDATKYINNGTSLSDVRAAVLNHLRQNNSPIATRGTGEANVTADEQDKFRAAMADALVMRGGVAVEKPADGARELMGMSLRDIAIETMQREGETGLNRRSSDELYTMLTRAFYNPSAAFPTIMDTAINKAYVEGHRTVPVTFDKWTKKGTLKDFKTHDNNYLAGPAGEFLEVPEGGELKHDKPSDEKRPTRKLKTYGRQFTMTRQAFINDDIDFLSKIPAKYAASARKTQNKQVYEILIKNPAVYDGVKLFSTAHKNVLATGTGITQVAVQNMFMALQMQTDEFGEAIIIRPTYIIVPVGYSFDMYTLFYSQTINTSGNTQSTNPLYRYREMIEVIEDPTINVLCKNNAMPWFVVGDKSDTDFIEVDYLNGQEIPTIRRMETPGTLGFVWDIYLDWGISVMDWRGAVKNPGIPLTSPLA
jgi:hypothetical protein